MTIRQLTQSWEEQLRDEQDEDESEAKARIERGLLEAGANVEPWFAGAMVIRRKVGSGWGRGGEMEGLEVRKGKRMGSLSLSIHRCCRMLSIACTALTLLPTDI